MRTILLHQTIAEKMRPVLISVDSIAYIKSDPLDGTFIGLTGGQSIQVDEDINQVCKAVESNGRIAEFSAAPATTPERPKTITFDELRPGDEIEVQGKRHAIEERDLDGDFSVKPSLATSSYLHKSELSELLARGVQVYRDGKLISGWPVKSPPAYVIEDPVHTYEEVLAVANRNIKRVAELEAELAAWKAAANHQAKSKIESPDELSNRINALEAELAAIKSQPQEVPRLDEGRVLATAAFIAEQIAALKCGTEKRMWAIVRDAIRSAMSSRNWGDTRVYRT